MAYQPLHNELAPDPYRAALDFHALPVPGKLRVGVSKSLATPEALALAYSPGVAAPCEEIQRDPAKAHLYTGRSNTVGVISNGTAVLGLGNIGALASKPVMEGKAALFKVFADIDAWDIEIDENSPERFIGIVRALSPSFGGINLEDIKAPECFEIERALQAALDIPVFHDDQHGTAIVLACAVANGLFLTGRSMSAVKICTSGAGAAAIACMNLLVDLGVQRKNIFISDSKGLVTTHRSGALDPWRAAFAQHLRAADLEEVMEGADIFVGLSRPGALTTGMLDQMAARPLVFALSNPVPEMMPEDILACRPDAIVATGRSDYPNQVNNLLCFPYIFRGALDCGATCINSEMKRAAVEALVNLSRQVEAGRSAKFGTDNLVPSPFDARLITAIAPAVALAAARSGIAQRPIADIDAYRARLRDRARVGGWQSGKHPS